jgi:hypothetical protein
VEESNGQLIDFRLARFDVVIEVRLNADVSWRHSRTMQSHPHQMHHFTVADEVEVMR